RSGNSDTAECRRLFHIVAVIAPRDEARRPNVNATHGSKREKRRVCPILPGCPTGPCDASFVTRSDDGHGHARLFRQQHDHVAAIAIRQNVVDSSISWPSSLRVTKLEGRTLMQHMGASVRNVVSVPYFPVVPQV